MGGQGHLIGTATTIEYGYPSPFVSGIDTTFDASKETAISRVAYTTDLRTNPRYNSIGAGYFRNDLSNGLNFMLYALPSPDYSSWDGTNTSEVKASFQIDFTLDTASKLGLSVDGSRGGLTSYSTATSPFYASVVLEKWVNGSWELEYNTPTLLADWASFTPTQLLNQTPLNTSFEGPIYSSTFDPGLYRLSAAVESAAIPLTVTISPPSITVVPEPGTVLLALLAVPVVRRRQR